MLMEDKISALFLCADILDYPSDDHHILDEFQLLVGENLEDFDFNEVQSEYIRIFLIGSTTLQCVPYASWWIDGKMSGITSGKINDFYTSCGYKFDAQNMKKPADNISFMIRFVAILAEENRFKEVKEFANFLTWMDDFANSLDQATDMKIFKYAASMSSDIINSLKEEV